MGEGKEVKEIIKGNLLRNMDINFSRHAKRRMELYKIDEKDVIKIINSYLSDIELVTDKQEIVNKEFLEKYGHPLKVVFCEKNDKIIVVTVYPVRKERRK